MYDSIIMLFNDRCLCNNISQELKCTACISEVRCSNPSGDGLDSDFIMFTYILFVEP